jgi:hypothetical protein
MNQSTTDSAGAARGVRLAAIGTALWLAIAAISAFLAVQAGFRVAPNDLATVALLAAGVAAPIAAIALLALLFGRNDSAGLAMLAGHHERAADVALTLHSELAAIDAQMGTIVARMEELRRATAEGGAALEANTAQISTAANLLGTATTEAGASADTLRTTLPAAQAHAETIGNLLDTSAAEARRQLGDIETLLAGVWARNDEAQRQAEAAATRMQAVFAEIEAASDRAATAVGDKVGAINTSVDTALDRTTTALDATRDGVHAQTSALLAAVDQARVALDHIGGDASRAIGKRLDKLLEFADRLGTQLGEQDARSRLLVDTIERSFMVLDGKLGHSATQASSTLAQLDEKLVGVRATIDDVSNGFAGLGAPITTTETAIVAIEAVLARLRTAADGAVTTLGETLPATAKGLATLTESVDALHDRTDALAAPVEHGVAAIAAADAAFAAQRATLDDATNLLAARLAAAHADLAAIEAQAQGTAMDASNALIEVLGRVREVAAASTGTMKTTIDGLIAEAEIALDKVGSERVEAAFGGPVRAQIAEIEAATTRAAAATQAATERLSTRLLGLTQTVATVEARIDEVDAKFDMRGQTDLSERASALIEQMSQASIDISKRLSLDVGDDAWAAYLKGDRNIFARRAVTLLDRDASRAIARLFTHDPSFRDAATHYIGMFETMLKRVVTDREGKALAVTLVSSDIGKLYVALAQAFERVK